MGNPAFQIVWSIESWFEMSGSPIKPALSSSAPGGGEIVVVGGGAAGYFAAIAAAEADPGARVTILERTGTVLAKVRVSGGGRCNVTHACFDPRELSGRYPRGGRALIGLFSRFGPRETIEWFRVRGVELKTEVDGRMFPVTDSSATIVDALEEAARQSGVRVERSTGVAGIVRAAGGRLELVLAGGGRRACDRLVWAGGGAKAGRHPLEDIGHAITLPVPSLFTFRVELSWLGGLSGVSVDPVCVSVAGTKQTQTGPLLITHAGVSGPAVLRLSAWGARDLHERSYQFELHVHWLPGCPPEEVVAEIQKRRQREGGQRVEKARWGPLPGRLWERLVASAGIAAGTSWSKLPRDQATRLAGVLTRTVLPVTGKSLNKEEFVTCGGIPLAEVELPRMESRVAPGVFLAGEALDIDGITGGFNFQAAWTTGWLAGRSAAES